MSVPIRGLLLASWCVMQPGLSAQAAYPTYDRVDYVTVQDFQRFKAIWDKAKTQNVRIAMFGDSQENPFGAGKVYFPRLNYRFFQYYGKVGETSMAPGKWSYSGHWLLMGHQGTATGTAPTSLTSDQLLPDHYSQKYTSSAYGMLTLLDPYNKTVAAGALLNTKIPSWDIRKPLYAILFAHQFSGSDEIRWRASPTNASTRNFYLTDTATGTTSMGLNSAAGRIVSQTIGPLPFGTNNNRMQLIAKGAGTAGADFVGIRFSCPGTTGGVSITSFAAGGYRTETILLNHANAGPMLAALGPWDALIIHTGVNDAFSAGKNPDQFKADMRALIDTIRGPQWLNKPGQKFILITDPFRHNNPDDIDDVAKHGAFDQYAGVLASLAAEDVNIMAVNSRRLTAEWGWTAANTDTYLADGVHYTDYGARILAEADYTLMLNGTKRP